MLYKKYHRNFVRQFKVGFRFKLSNHVHIQTVISGPSIDFTLIGSKPYVAIETVKVTLFPLVYWSGRLVEDSCHVI